MLLGAGWEIISLIGSWQMRGEGGVGGVGGGGGSHLRDQGGEGEGKSVKTWEDGRGLLCCLKVIHTGLHGKT